MPGAVLGSGGGTVNQTGIDNDRDAGKCCQGQVQGEAVPPAGGSSGQAAFQGGRALGRGSKDEPEGG